MESFNHFFASANTALGFQNNFKYINNENKNGYLYILKGGPGTGKSTLLKTIANHFEKIGEKVEYFHCSSDAKSLDGVRLIRKNISIVDGTAPHIIETTIPMVSFEPCFTAKQELDMKINYDFSEYNDEEHNNAHTNCAHRMI